MKFLFAVTDFAMGGITSSLKNLSDELISRGHEVAFLNLSGDKEYPVKFNPKIEFIEIKGIAKYWNIGIADFAKAKGIKKAYWLLIGVLKKILVKLGLWEKVIFSRTPKIKCDAAIAFRQSLTLNYIVTRKVIAEHTVVFIHSEIDGNTSGWMPYLEDVEHIACVSDAVSKAFAECYPKYKDKVSTVYNLFDEESIEKKGNRENPYNDSTFKIVTVARLDKKQKRVDKIPEIVNELIKKGEKKFHWYIVGEGSDRGLVEENIKKYGVEEFVTLTGLQKNPYPYIKNADLFVLISPWESYGMVLVESLILGTPVLAAEYPAVYEIIDNGKNGIITENSMTGVVSGIEKLIEEPELYNSIKENCVKYEYSPDTAYNQLMKLV